MSIDLRLLHNELQSLLLKHGFLLLLLLAAHLLLVLLLLALHVRHLLVSLLPEVSHLLCQLLRSEVSFLLQPLSLDGLLPDLLQAVLTLLLVIGFDISLVFLKLSKSLGDVLLDYVQPSSLYV